MSRMCFLLQVPESWLVNLPSTIGVASILGFFCWYFISQLKQQQEKHEKALNDVTERYEASIERMQAEYKADRADMQLRLDKSYEKYAVLTGMATDALTQVTKGQSELLTAIRDIKTAKHE